MSLARLLTDTVTVQRRTRIETDYGYDNAWAGVGQPLRCKLQLTSTYEQVGNRDTVVNLSTATFLGHPDLRPDDRLTDQRGRVFDIDGDLDFTGKPSKPFTVARLRKANDI